MKNLTTIIIWGAILIWFSFLMITQIKVVLHGQRMDIVSKSLDEQEVKYYPAIDTAQYMDEVIYRNYDHISTPHKHMKINICLDTEQAFVTQTDQAIYIDCVFDIENVVIGSQGDGVEQVWIIKPI